MPHITVQMYPGRNDETKEQLQNALKECTQNVLHVPEEAVTISLEEVLPEDWQRVVVQSNNIKK